MDTLHEIEAYRCFLGVIIWRRGKKTILKAFHRIILQTLHETIQHTYGDKYKYFKHFLITVAILESTIHTLNPPIQYLENIYYCCCILKIILNGLKIFISITNVWFWNSCSLVQALLYTSHRWIPLNTFLHVKQANHFTLRRPQVIGTVFKHTT